MCIFFLYGNCPLKSNKGVLSKKGNNYIIETEDKNSIIDTFSFEINEIASIKVNVIPSGGTKEKLGYHTTDYLESYFVGHMVGEFDTYQAIKISKIYEINITLKNNTQLCIQSKKNPNSFFQR